MMKNVLAIARKEFKEYFGSPMAYIFITVFLLLVNFFYVWFFFIQGQAEMRSFFGPMPYLFLFMIPAVTMRLWAEERKMGTRCGKRKWCWASSWPAWGCSR